MRHWAWGLWFVSIVGCANGVAFGEYCEFGEDCASGLCEVTARVCTRACEAESDCVSEGPYRLVCDAGMCSAPCSPFVTRGDGASREVCTTEGHFAPCSTALTAERCDVCGCEPYGGGACVEWVGCLTPQPNGASCTAPYECESGSCHRDTSTCGAPRATGEPCSADWECATRNCSTDGDPSMVGHCNQMLGSSCAAPGASAGSFETDTCTLCARATSGGAAVCLRAACDFNYAPNCPSFAGHDFDCWPSTEGAYHCYERCETERDSCFAYTQICLAAGDFCR